MAVPFSLPSPHSPPPSAPLDFDMPPSLDRRSGGHFVFTWRAGVAIWPRTTRLQPRPLDGTHSPYGTHTFFTCVASRRNSRPSPARTSSQSRSCHVAHVRSEEHTSELQSHSFISY